MSFTYEELVQQYLVNRQKKKDLKKAYEAEVKQIDEFQALIESYFDEEVHRTKLLNFKTLYGTAYRYRQTSVRTKDKAEFSKFIIDNHVWGLLDARPVKEAAVSWLEDCGLPPPGLIIERFDKIRVLSPGQKPEDDD